MTALRRFVAPDDNFRVVPAGHGVSTIRRDFAPPLPVGTHIVKVFRIAGYDRDCDGSAMARLEAVDREGRASGWTANAVGLYEDSVLVVDGEPSALWADAGPPNGEAGS